MKRFPPEKLVLILLPLAVILVFIGGVSSHKAEKERQAKKLADNLNDAERCIDLHSEPQPLTTARCNRVDADLLPIELKPEFAKALASNSTLEAKAKAKKEKRAEAELKRRKEAAAKLEAERIARGDWTYSTGTDEATGKTTKSAFLTSKNSMNFDSPYEGIQYGRFVVRNHPRFGVDAYLSIDKGQLLCNSYSNSTVLVRFDNGAASSYSCGEPADYSSDVVFIRGVGRLENRMKTAKKMFITISVYNEGSRTWEFNVRGYDRSKL
jgi:hypothetical protein